MCFLVPRAFKIVCRVTGCVGINEQSIPSKTSPILQSWTFNLSSIISQIRSSGKLHVKIFSSNSTDRELSSACETWNDFEEDLWDPTGISFLSERLFLPLVDFSEGFRAESVVLSDFFDFESWAWDWILIELVCSSCALCSNKKAQNFKNFNAGFAINYGRLR